LVANERCSRLEINRLILFRQYEEIRRSNRATGYGVESGFFDVVGDKKLSKVFQAVSCLC
jgi:hypothetical protein